jgi:signal transduction histidine kinase
MKHSTISNPHSFASPMEDELMLKSAIEMLTAGEYEQVLAMPGLADVTDELAALDAALKELAQALQAQRVLQQKLDTISARWNAGFLLEEVLENAYHDFKDIIPYNRIGLALLEDGGQVARSWWAKSDLPEVRLGPWYAAPVAGSSLERVLQTGQPRILNDLAAYLEQKPGSDSTRRIVEEGLRSSLTCPLFAHGNPLGFIFFSNVKPNTYSGLHVETFQRIAAQLSAVVERGRLVTELSNQKAAYQMQNEELRRSNELRNTLLGVAAHDLRTPIGNIQMGTTLLMDPDAWQQPEERMAFLETFLPTMERQTRHMMNLLDDLLDISTIEAGKLVLEREELGLPRFLYEVVERHAQMAAPKGTRVLLEEAEEGRVFADPNRLVQVMDNLISNAVKYSPPGSTVRVSAGRSQKGWLFRVQDEGPGILDSDRARLFQNFSRLSARPTGGEKSTGLGLAITRRVVEAHGGQVGVDSEPGGGATFWFTMPEEAIDS